MTAEEFAALGRAYRDAERRFMATPYGRALLNEAETARALLDAARQLEDAPGQTGREEANDDRA